MKIEKVKAILLLASFFLSYDHLVTILLYVKETFKLEKVMGIEL